MTVKFRRGKWIIDITWPDRRRSRISCVSEDQAKDLDLRCRASRVDGSWRELRAKLQKPDPIENLTLERATELYTADYVKPNNRSLRSKRSRLAILARIVGKRTLLQSIDGQTIAGYVSRRRAKGVTNRTINRDVTVLRHLTAWCVKVGYLEADPLDKIERLTEEEWVGERPEEEVIDRIFSHLRADVLPLFEFIRETGCRREEALALRHRHVDLERRVVLFARTKSGKARQVPLTQAAIAAIRTLPKHPRSDFVFYNPESGSRWSDCRKPWLAARETAGAPRMRVHDLRHAYAIKLAEAGVPLHFVAEVLGHSSVDFCRKQYAKFSPESASKAVLAVLEGGKIKGKKTG